jgi:hypothetical protein
MKKSSVQSKPDSDGDGLPKLPSGVVPKGPRYWRSIWRNAVHLYYGNPIAAHKWMMAPWHPFGGKRPVDLTITSAGRAQVLQEIDRLEQFKFEGSPRTAWRACRAFYPSPFNGCLLFRKTVLPATDLFHHLARGGNVDSFLRENPEVNRKQVDEVFDQVITDLCDF